MERESREFRRKFPNLSKEIKEGSGSIPINAVRNDEREADRVAHAPGYSPSVIDFIRRCDTESQALEIIDFLEKKGEIGHEYAARLRKQLTVSGLRSFGSKRLPGDYWKR